jgi:peptidoglycan biosynthesis protein MviN/MurJ (putative lipid II flippase)
MPRLSRSYTSSGLLGLTRALRGTQAFLLVVSVPYLLAVVIFSEPLLHLLYGAKYSGLSTELRLWAVVALLLVIIRPLDMWLLASRNSRTLFMRKLLGALATVMVAVPLLPIRGVEGALCAIIGGMVINSLGLVAAVYRPGNEAEAAEPSETECRASGGSSRIGGWPQRTSGIEASYDICRRQRKRHRDRGSGRRRRRSAQASSS